MWCETQNSGYKIRSDPVAATRADLTDDIDARALVPGAMSGRPVAPDSQPVLIVTTNEIPGYRITRVHGDVFGLVVLARNVFSNMGAQLRAVAGGEVSAYTRLLTDSRNQARRRMWREARS
jgi:Putative heavy-metal-binding